MPHRHKLSHGSVHDRRGFEEWARSQPSLEDALDYDWSRKQEKFVRAAWFSAHVGGVEVLTNPLFPRFGRVVRDSLGRFKRWFTA